MLLAFFFFIPVPSFLSEYFGHCHVLLGTFEKVSGYRVGLTLVRVARSFPGGGMEFVCWLPGRGWARPGGALGQQHQLGHNLRFLRPGFLSLKPKGWTLCLEDPPVLGVHAGRGAGGVPERV